MSMSASAGILAKDAYYTALLPKKAARLADAKAALAKEEERLRLQQGGLMQPQPQSSMQLDSSSADSLVTVASSRASAAQQSVPAIDLAQVDSSKPVSSLSAVTKAAHAVDTDQAVQHEQSPCIAAVNYSSVFGHGNQSLAEIGTRASASTEADGNSCVSTTVAQSSTKGIAAEHTAQAVSLSSPASSTSTIAPRTSTGGVCQTQDDSAAASDSSHASGAAKHEGKGPSSLDASTDGAGEPKHSSASDSSAR